LGLKITIVCSNPAHPVNTYLSAWVHRHGQEHDIELVRKKSEFTGGDMLFLVSCGEIISAKDRSLYSVCLVLHASDLPRGRGWSPHIWELASGASYITLSLLEAEDKVDSGRIWQKVQIPVPQTALWDEINHLLFKAEVQLMDFALTAYGCIQPEEQPKDATPSYYQLRTPRDSRIDPHKSLVDQFDLIRVCDPQRFPAFFEYRGQRYALKLEKLNDE
jgi:methionyl-tRNA formyltransferase